MACSCDSQTSEKRYPRDRLPNLIQRSFRNCCAGASEYGNQAWSIDSPPYGLTFPLSFA